MELVIYQPTPEQPIQAIEWNHEDLKQELSIQLKKYKGIVVTEETVKDGKSDMAKLRKLRTSLEDKRKEIKKLCLAPYDNFEKQVKELVALIDEPIEEINSQVKEFDEQRKAEKIQGIRDYFDERVAIAELDFVEFEQIFDPTWENASKSIKSIQDEINERIGQVYKDLEAVRKLRTGFNFEVLEKFKETLDLGKALEENNRLIEQAERKKEAEAQKDEAVAFPVMDPTQADQAPSRPPTKKNEKTYETCFVVSGTYEQLMNLSTFLKINSYNYRQAKEAK